MKGNEIFVTLFITLISFSCSHKISPERPLLFASDFKLDSLPVSEINIPIQINLKPFYSMAENQVDTLFTSPNYPDGWVQDNCATRYKYSFRRSPLQLSASGTLFTLGFMGYYRIIGSTRVCVGGAAISPWTAPCRCGFDEPERRVNVSFTNSLTMLPDYKLKLQVRRNEPQALDKCEICFWGQDITKDVLDGLKEELDTAKAALERSYGTIDLKPQFQQVWNQLMKPYNIYDMGWLQMNPQTIKINNLFAREDSLYVYLGLSAKPVISFEKPEEKMSIIPAIGPISRQQGFSIFLDARLNYDSLSTIVNRHIANKEFDFNKGPVKKKFIIRDCQLYGTGNEKLIIRVNFGGTDNGTFYLTGKPVYTHENRILEITNIDFDIRSKDALLKSSEWLFSRRIINEISRNTKFDLGTYIDSAKITINEQLNREWIKGTRSYGQIEDIRLIGIYPFSQSLIIRSSCTGDLSVKMDSVDFSL